MGQKLGALSCLVSVIDLYRKKIDAAKVLAAALVWKSIQTYSLTQKLFPAAVYGVISAAMGCFYAYVVLSGGNPPPKKKPVAVES